MIHIDTFPCLTLAGSNACKRNEMVYTTMSPSAVELFNEPLSSHFLVQLLHAFVLSANVALIKADNLTSIDHG